MSKGILILLGIMAFIFVYIDLFYWLSGQDSLIMNTLDAIVKSITNVWNSRIW